MTNQDKPITSTAEFTAQDIKCLEIAQCWLKENQNDGCIPKDVKIEKIRFVHTGNVTTAYLTIPHVFEASLKIMRPQSTETAAA